MIERPAEQKKTTITKADPILDGVFMKNNPAFLYTVNASVSQEEEAAEQSYQQCMDQFFAELEKHPSAQDEMLHLLDEGRVQGLFNMLNLNARPAFENLYLRNLFQFHTPEHCKELESDVQKVLQSDKHLQAAPAFVKAFYIHLTRMAAAWHDNKLGIGPPQNEIISGKLFALDLSKRLAAFKQKYSGEAYSSLRAAIAGLESQLALISQKLIVDPTLLLFAVQARTLIAVPLETFINELVRARGIKRTHQGGQMKMLRACGEAVMIGDTKRVRLPHTLGEERLLTTALATLPPSQERPIQALLSYIHEHCKDLPMDPAAVESYLICLCKNIGIFPEENIPEGLANPIFAAKESYLSKENHEQFTQAFDELRSLGLHHSPLNLNLYGSLLLMFITTKSKKKDPDKEKENLLREIEFAQMMGNPHYATFLEAFALYVKSLLGNKTELSQLGYTLMLLASHFQPGHQMLLNDPQFRQKILQEVRQQEEQIKMLGEKLAALKAQSDLLHQHLQQPAPKPTPSRLLSSSSTILHTLQTQFLGNLMDPASELEELAYEQTLVSRNLQKAEKRQAYLLAKLEAYKERLEPRPGAAVKFSLSAMP